MKITDPEVIRNGEKDLIDSVQEDLDLDAVREILKERMAVAALASKGGQIVVHDNNIAFRLDFEINMSGSLLFDRDGNFIDEQAPQSASPEPEAGSVELDMDDELLDDNFGFPEPDDDTSESDQDLDDEEEELSIDLPDYGLDDDDLDDELDTGLEDDITEEAPTDNQAADPGLDVEDLDDEDLGLDDDTVNKEVAPDSDSGENTDLDNESSDTQDLDDDINDILKESREFWEQKKES
ncbi:MAG: hypothetical protein MI892_18040 [Desulfobacterales bacterium]|nr:hypothetical protein [Desulfobacterales bacterium]